MITQVASWVLYVFFGVVTYLGWTLVNVDDWAVKLIGLAIFIFVGLMFFVATMIFLYQFVEYIMGGEK